MADFYGTYVVTLEETGRFRLPQDFIDAFGDSAVMCKGEGQYLEIYPAAEWQAFMEEYRSLPRPRPKETELRMEPRLQSRKEVQIQGKGRLTVPKEHRDYAELKDKEILLLGMLDHIRLSSVEKHKESEDKRRAQQMYWR